MLQPLLSQSTTPLLRQVARFAERRQDVLAGNVANIDTPGYRMRELPVQEFQHALQRAVASLAPPARGGLGGGFDLSTALSVSQNPPYPPLAGGAKSENPLDPLLSGGATMQQDLFPETLFQAYTPSEQPGLTFQDANNRSPEHLFLEMTKNSLRQNFALELLRSQYDQLQTVISERA
jgi:flagellar basal-body rod protein FlgB